MEQYQVKNEISDMFLNEAVELLKKFQNDYSSAFLLHEAANKLTESINYNNENVKALIYMSYIFFVIEKDKIALDFLKIAQDIDPKNNLIKKLKDAFKKNQSDVYLKYDISIKQVIYFV